MTWTSIVGVFFFLFASISAIAALRTTNLRTAVILSSGAGLAAVVLFVLMKAPDVALTEAVIGAGFATLVLLVGVSKTRVEGDRDE